jgi:hypothetical protein
LCFNRLLVGRKRYFVLFIIVIGLVLTGALGTTSIFRVGDNYIIIRLIVEINGFLIISI